MTISTTPLSDSAEVEALPEASPPPACAAAQQFKVLVVDDSPIVRRIVGRRIEKLPRPQRDRGRRRRGGPGDHRPRSPRPCPHGHANAADEWTGTGGRGTRKIFAHSCHLDDGARQRKPGDPGPPAGAANYVSKKTLNEELAGILNRVLAVTTVRGRRQRVLGCLEVREVRFKLGCDPDLVGPLIEMLLDDLAFLAFCDSTARIQVGVALQEAIVNALYHGNLELGPDLHREDEQRFQALAEERRRLDPYRERYVEVHSRVDRNAACFVVRDQGPGFDTSRVDRPIADDDLTQAGGRGLLLIRTFMDHMQYNDVGNQLTMIRRRSP